MPMNVIYKGSADLPENIPVFPLAGALLLPRGQLPLNIFEPRYLEMIDDSLRDGHRLIGMIQPDPAHPGPEDKPTLFKVGCVGRITQIAESGDGRYLLQLTGVARFRVEQELKVATAYRQCRVTYQPFADDFIARKGEDEVDRKAVLEALTSFLKANNLKTDWQGVESAPNERALFFLVELVVARGRARCLVAADVDGLPPEQRRQPGPCVGPGALVGRLLLHPAYVLRLRIARDRRA